MGTLQTIFSCILIPGKMRRTLQAQNSKKLRGGATNFSDEYINDVSFCMSITWEGAAGWEPTRVRRASSRRAALQFANGRRRTRSLWVQLAINRALGGA
jgi:hypothetical protein